MKMKKRLESLFKELPVIFGTLEARHDELVDADLAKDLAMTKLLDKRRHFRATMNKADLGSNELSREATLDKLCKELIAVDREATVTKKEAVRDFKGAYWEYELVKLRLRCLEALTKLEPDAEEVEDGKT